MIYQAIYNEYLECYKHCKTCSYPWVNHDCLTCVPGAYLYTDTKGLYAVANRSCWEAPCAPGTYLNTTSLICEDCPDYCVCQASDPLDCLGCVNSTFYFDNVREKCFIECPHNTIYNPTELTCVDCSSLCNGCVGYT